MTTSQRSRVTLASFLVIVLAATGAALAQTGVLKPAEEREMLVEDVVAWVNDDVVLWSEVREAEADFMRNTLAEQSGARTPEIMTAAANKARNEVLIQLIHNRLLVQQAERLFDLEILQQDLLERWKRRNDITDDDKLNEMLDKFGMTREDLMDRLTLASAPGHVIDSQIMGSLGISEEEAREYYENNKSRFATEASVVFREIVLEARDPSKRAQRRAEAEKIVAEARGGADFATLVEAYSEAPSKAIGGRIGPLDPADLREEISEAAMEAELQVASEPIETSNGWHILFVEERTESTVPTFEEVKVECEELCRRERFEEVYEDYVLEIWEDSTIEVRTQYADRLPAEWMARVALRD